LKPKRLNIREMWELYKTLKSGVEEQQEYLIDEVFNILERVSKEDFLQSLWMLYPKIEFSKHNPVEMATMFVAGLKHNGFFAFVEVIQGMNRGNSK
jgi:hypothetical protein